MHKRLGKAAGSLLTAILLVGPVGTASANGGWAGGCMHGTPPSAGDGSEVSMIDSCFEATVLRVPSGSDVTWTNEDAMEHTVTGVGLTWGSMDAVAPGGRVTYSFAGDGVYVYSCLIHPGMVGAVVVGSGRGDAGLQPVAVAVTGSTDGTVGGAAGETPASGITSGIVGGAVGIALGVGIAGAMIARKRTVRVV